MEVIMTARNAAITERFRAHVEERQAKIEALADDPQVFKICLSRHHDAHGAPGPDRVELTVTGRGPLVRAEADGADKYVAFDAAFARLLERLRRARDRRKIHHGARRRLTSLREAMVSDFHDQALAPADAALLTEPVGSAGDRGLASPARENEQGASPGEWSPVVIRRKHFSAEPIDLDEALSRMELVGHDFYLFLDLDTALPSVVYRRRGWDYGVISLERVGPGPTV